MKSYSKIHRTYSQLEKPRGPKILQIIPWPQDWAVYKAEMALDESILTVAITKVPAIALALLDDGEDNVNAGCNHLDALIDDGVGFAPTEAAEYLRETSFAIAPASGLSDEQKADLIESLELKISSLHQQRGAR